MCNEVLDCETLNTCVSDLYLNESYCVPAYSIKKKPIEILQKTRFFAIFQQNFQEISTLSFWQFFQQVEETPSQNLVKLILIIYS